MISSRSVLLSLVLLVAGVSVDAFAPVSTRSVGALTGTASATLVASSKRDDDFPMEEKGDDSNLSVDWDAEWKKVVEEQKKGESVERPGKDFYKSDAEIAAIRAANKAQTEVQKISSNIPSPPSMGSLTGDWRFWIGILALISIGSAVLSAPPSYPPISGGDSYYI